MNDVMLSSLKSYWERLRAGRIAPYRAEMDPRQFQSALENMFIVEKLSPDNMRIRLAGMKICEMMGMEVRGMQPGFLIDEADRLRFERLMNVVMGEPAVVELKLEAPNRAGLYRATMLLMPLRSDFGDVNRVLGCTSGEGELFAPPLAFTIQDVGVTPIEPSQGAERRQPLPGFAEPIAEFAAPGGAEAALDRGQPERRRQAARRQDPEAPCHRLTASGRPSRATCVWRLHREKSRQVRPFDARFGRRRQRRLGAVSTRIHRSQTMSISLALSDAPIPLRRGSRRREAISAVGPARDSVPGDPL